MNRLINTLNAPGPRLTLIAVSVMIIIPMLLVVPPHVPQNALWWDYFMALGYLATGLLLLLPLITTRFWFLLGGDAVESREILSAHRIVTYVMLLLLMLHIGGLLIIDPLVVEYLKPSAPWGMLAALLATVAIALSIVQSEFRIKLNMRHNRWRYWHSILTVVAVAGTFYHLLEAKYFVRSVSEFFTLAVLCAAAGGLIFLVKRNYQPGVRVANSGAGQMLLRVTLLMTVLTSIVVFVFAIPADGNRSERQALQCLLEDC